MLAAYFDDSGTHRDSKVVTWGGFIGTTAQWDAFDAAWRAKLSNPLPGKPRLRKFSLASCQALQDEFQSYARAESDLLQNEFRQIIIDHRLLGVAFSIDRATFDRLMPTEAIQKFGDSEVMSFSSCFNAAIERAETYFPNETQLSLHFDQGRRAPKLNAIVDHVQTRYCGLPELVNISFDKVEEFTPLQAADIIATENFWDAQRMLDGKTQSRPHLAHFLKGVSTEGYIFDEPQIRMTLKDHNFSALDSHS